MKITLKNVKISEFASHETFCFQATVYVNGKRSFMVDNEGMGGPNNYYGLKGKGNPYQEIAKIEKELASGPQIKDLMDNCLEVEIGNRLNEFTMLKEAKKVLRRVAYVRDGEVYQLQAKFKPTPKVLERVKHATWWKPDNILLNGMSPEQVVKYL